MSMTMALAGWITIGSATIWGGQGVRALIASRRAAARSGPRVRARNWQRLALATPQAILGVWFITGVSTGYPAIFWWLIAGFGALLAWMVITDVRPRLRSRGTAPR
jgi:hypothetical protein